MSKPTGNLRAAMPETAVFIDAMRAAFGVDEINSAIKAGMAGAGTFWASENGMEVGSQLVIDPAKMVSAAEMVIRRPAIPERAKK